MTAVPMQGKYGFKMTIIALLLRPKLGVDDHGAFDISRYCDDQCVQRLKVPSRQRPLDEHALGAHCPRHVDRILPDRREIVIFEMPGVSKQGNGNRGKMKRI